MEKGRVGGREGDKSRKESDEKRTFLSRKCVFTGVNSIERR